MQNRRTEPYTLDYFPYTKGQLNRWGHDKASDWLRGKVEKEAQTNWDSFYKNNGDKFFKKRHWITREYEELRDSDRNVVHTFLEVGCGTGATCMSNTLYSIHTVVFPLLEEFNPNLRVFAFDLSQHAIDIINKHELTLHPKYDNQITAFVYDATSESEQDIPHVAPNSIDFTTLIFVLSAIPPSKVKTAVTKIIRAVKPGGSIFLRDYAIDDLAQHQMGGREGHKRIEGNNLFMRGDLTLTYYFSTQEIRDLFSSLECVTCEYVRKTVTNHKEEYGSSVYSSTIQKTLTFVTIHPKAE